MIILTKLCVSEEQLKTTVKMGLNKFFFAFLLLLFLISIKSEAHTRSCFRILGIPFYTDHLEIVRHPRRISNSIHEYNLLCDNVTLQTDTPLTIWTDYYINISIQSLSIKDSFMPILNSTIFGGQSYFKIIVITTSSLSIIDSDFMNTFTNLETLNLAHNAIEIIQPNTFLNCTKLTLLDLSYNKLTSLKNIPKINNLEKLYIQFNKIASLEGISMLTKLMVFNASHNDNLEVTADVHTLKLLNEFDISVNNATKFKNCSNFKILLNLSNNKLTSICKNFCETIEQIDYGHNLISDIDNDTFKGLIKLKILILDDNFIKELPYDIFNDLKKLEVLELQHNNIGFITKGCLRHLNKLEILKLHNNRLKSIEYGSFSGLVSLSYLDLSQNHIYNFDAKIIYPVSSLNNLYLEENMLDNLDVDTFLQHLNNLESLSFSFSNVGCDHLIGIITTFYNKGVVVKTGHIIHKDNVNGISCNPDIKNATNTLEEIKLNKALLVMSRIYVVAIVICMIFALIVLSTIVVICFYLSKNCKRCFYKN